MDNFNWTDFTQAAIASGILLIQIGVLFNPVGAGITAGIFIAEMGLFIWELAEDELKNDRKIKVFPLYTA